MFEGTGIEDLVNSVVVIIWFVASITLLIFMYNRGYDISANTKQLVTSNETIVSSLHSEAEYGYYDGDEYKYDGALEGYEVIESVLSSDNLTIYINNNGSLTNLNSLKIYQQNFLDYVKNVDKNKLNAYVDVNGVYVRQYTINAHGDVVQVIYKKVE